MLIRWFPEEKVEIPQAQYLDIILYSREQLTKEYTAMPDAKGDPQLLPQAPWGIISIKAQVSVMSDSMLQSKVLDSLAAGM